MCLGSGTILDWPNGATAFGSVPCPECSSMSNEERTEYYKAKRIVYYDRAKAKWVEESEWRHAHR